MKKLPRSFMPRWGPWYKRYAAFNATSPVGVRLEIGYGLGVNLSGAILGEGLHIGYMPKKRNDDIGRRGIRVEFMATDIQAGSGITRRFQRSYPSDLPKEERERRHQRILRAVRPR